MGTNVTGTMKGDPWAPRPFGLSENGGPMLSCGTVTNHYTGDLEGKGSQEALIITQPDGVSEMVAVERVTAKLGGRTGGLVLRLAGTTLSTSAPGTVPTAVRPTRRRTSSTRGWRTTAKSVLS